MTVRQWILPVAAGLKAINPAAGVAEVPQAIFTRNLGGGQKLYAYLPERVGNTSTTGKITDEPYGPGDKRFPKIPYFCSWRDTDPIRLPTKANVGPPGEIWLVCIFGTSAWPTPAKPLGFAQQFLQRAHATVKIGWKGRDGSYAMNRMEVEITDVSVGRDFRSIWRNDEIARIAVKRREIVFPKSPTDPIKFAVTASVPRRYNSGDISTAPIATFTMTGTALPVPSWIPY